MILLLLGLLSCLHRVCRGWGRGAEHLALDLTLLAYVKFQSRFQLQFFLFLSYFTVPKLFYCFASTVFLILPFLIFCFLMLPFLGHFTALFLL